MIKVQSNLIIPNESFLAGVVALTLINSYLSDRRHFVKINGRHSNYINITISVPQGPILGPLLLILYINDVLDLIPKQAISSYADDMNIISCEDTWSQSENEMNTYLDLVSRWLRLNKLSLNISKTVYI